MSLCLLDVLEVVFSFSNVVEMMMMMMMTMMILNFFGKSFGFELICLIESKEES